QPDAIVIFSFNCTPPPSIYPLSLHDALPILHAGGAAANLPGDVSIADINAQRYLLSLSGSRLFVWLKSRAQLRLTSQYSNDELRSEEHTSELQSRENLVCRLLLEKKKIDRCL